MRWLRKLLCKHHDEYIKALQNRIDILEKIIARREREMLTLIGEFEGITK